MAPFPDFVYINFHWEMLDVSSAELNFDNLNILFDSVFDNVYKFLEIAYYTYIMC